RVFSVSKLWVGKSRRKKKKATGAEKKRECRLSFYSEQQVGKMQPGMSLEVINEEGSLSSSLSSSVAAVVQETNSLISSNNGKHTSTCQQVNLFSSGSRKKATSVESLLTETHSGDWGVAEYVEPDIKEQLAKVQKGNYGALITWQHVRNLDDDNEDISSQHNDMREIMLDKTEHKNNNNGQDQNSQHEDDGIGDEILTESSSSVNTSHDDNDHSRPVSASGAVPFLRPDSTSSAEAEEDGDAPVPAPRKHKSAQQQPLAAEEEASSTLAELDETHPHPEAAETAPKVEPVLIETVAEVHQAEEHQAEEPLMDVADKIVEKIIPSPATSEKGDEEAILETTTTVEASAAETPAADDSSVKELKTELAQDDDVIQEELVVEDSRSFESLKNAIEEQ
ncbi:unnamed protein product, partial [Notodromas monacha]